MKKVTLLLSMSMGLLIVSCNNGTNKEESKAQDTAAATATTTAPPAETKPAFTPFKVVAIQHKVKNFDKARTGYFSKDSLLQSYGITHLVFARDLKDSNQVFIVDKVQDVDKAKAFFDDPKVEKVMANAGVS